MLPLKLTTALVVAGIFLIGLAGVEAGQVQPVEDPDEPPQQQQDRSAAPDPDEPDLPEIDKDTLADFVEAHIQVTEVREKYAGKLEEADEYEQVQDLQEQSETSANEAIEDSGMTVGSYEAVLVAINADPELRDKLNRKLEDAGVAPHSGSGLR